MVPTSRPEPAAPTATAGLAPDASATDIRDIFRREARYVWDTLRFLGIGERDLEDLMHDVFVTAHRRFSDYDPTRPVRPWLFGIALRTAMRFRMLARHRREVMLGDVSQGADVEDLRPTPEAELRRREARGIVAAAIEELSEDHRAIFVMVDLQEEPITEVAAGLGLGLNTAYSRLRRARIQFRDAVTRLGGGGAP